MYGETLWLLTVLCGYESFVPVSTWHSYPRLNAEDPSALQRMHFITATERHGPLHRIVTVCAYPAEVRLIMQLNMSAGCWSRSRSHAFEQPSFNTVERLSPDETAKAVLMVNWLREMFHTLLLRFSYISRCAMMTKEGNVGPSETFNGNAEW